MVVDPGVFLSTNFNEFDYYLNKIIIKKETLYNHVNYAWIYYFELPFGNKIHSIIYNNKVDIKEYNYLNSLPKEEFDEIYKELEKRNYTIMDSKNSVSEGIPNGFQGLKLNFSLYGEAPEFLQMLCYLFSGYFQYSDSSGEDYKWIDKDLHKVVEWVFGRKNVFI